MAILPDNEFYTFEDRQYINPQVSLNEQNAFVDNLRNTQKENTNQINMQTYNLGTAVPSNIGGLTGANSYFSSRYQTPQTNSLAANLRATAQAKALNDVLANEQTKMQKRYNDAYHTSQIRGSNGGGSGGGGGGDSSNPTGDPYKDGSVTENLTDEDQGTTSSVGDVEVKDTGSPFAGNNQKQISYQINGKTYYATIYENPGFTQDRTSWISVTTPEWPYLKHFKGQSGLDYLRSIVSNGGKIFNSKGEEVSPENAFAY